MTSPFSSSTVFKALFTRSAASSWSFPRPSGSCKCSNADAMCRQVPPMSVGLSWSSTATIISWLLNPPRPTSDRFQNRKVHMKHCIGKCPNAPTQTSTWLIQSHRGITKTNKVQTNPSSRPSQPITTHDISKLYVYLVDMSSELSCDGDGGPFGGIVSRPDDRKIYKLCCLRILRHLLASSELVGMQICPSHHPVSTDLICMQGVTKIIIAYTCYGYI